MAQKRGASSDLPRNLYRRRDLRSGRVYFTYKDRLSGKFLGFGTDESSAIREAHDRNALFEAARKQSFSQAVMKQGIPCVRGGVIDHNGLHDGASIVAAAQPVAKISGVYFLIADREIVYVGQSTDVATRIAAHLREGVKHFDRYAVIEFEAEELDSAEAAYINKLCPALNIYRPKLNEVI